MNETAAVISEEKTPPRDPGQPRLRILAKNLRRGLVIASWTITVLFVAGSIRWPSWWYAFLWQGCYKYPINYLALFYGTTGWRAVVGPLVTVIGVWMLWRERRSLAADADRIGGVSVIVCAVVVGVTMLVLNVTQRPKWRLIELTRKVVDSAEKPIDLITGWTKVGLDPPVAFYYLDQAAVEALTAQIEPDLVEKSRTEKAVQKRGAKVSVGAGGTAAAVEASTDVDATREFKRESNSPERKTLQLISYCLERKRAAILAEHETMVLNLVYPRMKAELRVLRYLTENPIDPVYSLEEMDKKRSEADQIIKDAEDAADLIVDSPPEFALVAMWSEKTIENANGVRTLESDLGGEPSHVVRISMPTSVQIPGFPGKRTGTPIRVFGHVTGHDATTISVQAYAVF